MEDVAKHPRLTKRKAVYWFRAKVPSSLVEAYAPKREITFSLKTKEYRTAVERVRVESVKLDQEFAAATAKLAQKPRSSISDTEIERLAVIHYHRRLEADDDFRAFGTDEDELYLNIFEQLEASGIEFSVGWTLEQLRADNGLSDREFTKAAEGTIWALEKCRERLARGDTSPVADYVNEILHEQGIKLDPKSIEHRKLSLAILKANVRALEAIERRNKGEVVDTPASLTSAVPTKVETFGNVSSGSTPSISQAFAEWRTQHNGPQKTADTFEVAVKRFVSLFGDKPVGTITKADIRGYRDAMLKFPAVMTKPQRQMAVADLIKSLEGSETKRLAPKTVNEKYLAGLSAILTLCENEAGYIETNPCKGIRAKDDETREPTRLMYTDVDIAKIMCLPIFTEGERPLGGAGEAAKWLPLLGMFSGARLEELARLTVADIGQQDGTHYLFIRRGEGGRRVKNASSIRKVPIHSILIQMGFLTFADQAEGRLFPLLNSKTEQASAAWSKWWGKYARANGLEDRQKVFHSFRHTVKRKLRDAKVDKTVRDAIAGHASDDIAEAYGLDHEGIGISLHVLAEAIEKISYPVLMTSETQVVAEQVRLSS